MRKNPMTEPQTETLLTSYLNDVNRLYQDWQSAFQVTPDLARYSTAGDPSEDEEAKRTAMIMWLEKQKEDLLKVLQSGSQVICQKWQTLRGQHDSFHENQHLMIALTTDIVYMLNQGHVSHATIVASILVGCRVLDKWCGSI
jgi:dsDNA-binding SOS-regulon protein